MAVLMSLQSAINYISENLTSKQLSKLLGVSENQIYKYKTGYTKTCSDAIVDRVYDNFKINGERILIDFFRNEQEYLDLRKIRESLGD